MKKVPLSVTICILTLVVLSCGLAERFVPSGPDLERRAELWSDVPRVDGLEPSEMEMPFAIKVFMRTALNNLWRLNKEGEDKTPAQGDWVVFTTDKTPADIQAFYTNDRMTTFGNWETSKKSTCLDGKESGIDGALCAFEKVADGKEILIALIAVQDSETKKTNVFFLRIEKPAKPGAANTSNAPAAAREKRGPIIALTGTAPYGIEKRPMPMSVDLDRLLPKQVGPYERMMLEKSEQRGTTPDSIKIDGSSVYATYRNGEKEIFVEFGVSTKAEDAQASLDVAAGDVAAGLFPTDPRFGSIGTEPSYLKVNNQSGAFIAWTRGGYYFSAKAKGGEANLDAFMNAFPY